MNIGIVTSVFVDNPPCLTSEIVVRNFFARFETRGQQFNLDQNIGEGRVILNKRVVAESVAIGKLRACLDVAGFGNPTLLDCDRAVQIIVQSRFANELPDV